MTNVSKEINTRGSDGVELAVCDYGGAGSPILLIHGAGRSLADWSLMLPYLLEAHRVVALDLRNHGRSGSGPWKWNVVLDDIIQVVTTLVLKCPSIVGHSLGGMIAALYGESVENCGSVVNLDGHGWGRPDQYIGFDADTVRRYFMEGQARLEEMPPGPLTIEQANVFKAKAVAMAMKFGLAEDIAVRLWSRTIESRPDGSIVLRPSRDEAIELMNEVDRLDLFALYRRVRRPLLVYNATGDGETSSSEETNALRRAYRQGLERDLTLLAAECPHVQKKTVALTHMLILESPQMIAQQVNEFIASTTQGKILNETNAGRQGG